jgi:erythromycin esterase
MKRAAVLLLVPILVALAGGCDSGPSGPEPPAPLTPVEYLREHAVAVRTLDIEDDDFSDLEPLKAMIGNARIVSLGEATHGDGATFQAKARLVKFLHREMGFDVLAWESGFWDVQRAWSDVAAGTPPAEALRRGVFGVWMRSAQVAPLVEYLDEASRTTRPLELVGFDMQFSVTTGAERAALDLPGDLAEVLRGHGSTAPDDPRFATFAAAVDTLTGTHWFYERPSPERRSEILSSIDFLREELLRLGGATGAGETAYLAQVLESVHENARAQWIWTDQGHFDDRIRYNNMRGRQMARNLAWYAERAFPSRKIIVWSATSHVMRDRAALQNLPAASWMSLGDHADAIFGDRMYVIGFTSHEGSWGYPDQPENTLAPMPAGSLEDRFVEAGFTHAIVDLRSPVEDGGWLREPFTSRPVGHSPIDYRWRQSLDALMFIREMTPSTPVGG